MHPTLSRRALLKKMGLATGLLATQQGFRLHAQSENAGKALKVIVIGGGLSGLCTAYELEQRGHECVVLEADPSHVGGRARTQRFDNGLYGELGAMRIPEVHDLTRKYVKQFGLTLRPFVQSNPEAYYFVRGRKFRIRDEARVNEVYNLTADEARKSPFELWEQSVLKALDKLSTEDKADLRRAVFQTDGTKALDQLSLEGLFKQGGLSPEAIEFLSVTWAYETMLSSAATETVREEMEEVWIKGFDEIVGGTDTLPRAFAQRLKNPLRLGARVVRVKASNGRATVHYRTQEGQQLRVDGDAVVCTVPLSVLCDIEFAPGLSGPKMRAARQVSYDSSTKVLAVTRRRFWESEDGVYGGGTFTDLPIGTVYYPADNAQAKDPGVSGGPGVMLASYTWGQPARRLAALSPADRARVTIDNLSKIHPQLQDPNVIERVVSWSWDNYQFTKGAFCWFNPGQQETLYQHIIAPEGRVFFAGEHASLTHTWMQGAFESAHRVVDQISHAQL